MISYFKYPVYFTPEHVIKACAPALEWDWLSKLRSGRFTSGKTDPLPIVQEAGWAQGTVWTDAQISTAPDFDPRVFHHVSSSYTDCAVM